MEIAAGLSIVIFIFVVFFLILFMYFVPLGLWVNALSAGVHVRIFADLVGMRLRKVPPGLVVRAKITAAKANKPMTARPLETRMGTGKGEPDHWVAVVRPGKVLFELAGVSKAAARECFARVAYKLPVKVRMVGRHV